VSKYVQDNFTPYNGDSSFLAGPSEKTKALWAVLEKACCEELQKGISGVDPHVPSTITAFGPGYINKEQEVIVGLQTDEPLKRAIKPLGGINMVKAALHVSGRLRRGGGGGEGVIFPAGRAHDLHNSGAVCDDMWTAVKICGQPLFTKETICTWACLCCVVCLILLVAFDTLSAGIRLRDAQGHRVHLHQRAQDAQQRRV
jgi:hypothetical protein